MNTSTREKKIQRHVRIRAQLHGIASRPRLSVSRSSRYIQVQLIDDDKGVTLLGISDSSLKGKGTKQDRARMLGKKVAEETLKLGVKSVVFDRGGHHYHGRIKALADAARQGGLTF
ncbi:MAG: 50S ribosomal protein L18 [Candidatus Ryanbacteria bacterium RIFCSPHIGHO2_12_FULL_47_12b]|uniref:Large ribosomal subunit protein uL18 n=2 Tax=Candidatus Ryaniibacteriota TaxID=1817914 RepID=A0A1G2H343_9BACT|nr:MAG: 50S ribosomal protein L18 [Parcubacteria group bacterium GW2011_GWA2_47_10b]KKU86092.1 MAG: 50S ribosomal protein L18 [Parcubacteria group bacterium GW2011_GWA1_47_9]OGZ44750.1 MAG: 50S ribosomal protein L18 [Candidatus Ryanbacteria bacterium RIFCSPHIGHO2_01_FULL_48_80]OGZ48299.1 MAG: 50S ribosomal protein L18 [Candidatus Ryanbacteria bacterium RIFCSPHIGHO2_02_FULL_47_25]OGZ51319.1 MAG: 50S ribosomal protein L18 [Candidatus Ryanbacteria bacterium RIFCSPHIGHO2_12_FULL_47_12b]OGZ52221.1 